MAYTRSWAANSINDRIRLKARCDLLKQKLASLTEEIRIKDARIAPMDPRNRPHYPATERMAILLLRAANGWSLKQTAKRFLVTSATIASWGNRVDEQGSSALVQLREPVNKFPELSAIDLTTVPLFGGFWTSWLPNAFIQRWPFCWWVAVVADYYSRRAMGLMIFRKQPTSRAVQVASA